MRAGRACAVLLAGLAGPIVGACDREAPAPAASAGTSAVPVAGAKTSDPAPPAPRSVATFQRCADPVGAPPASRRPFEHKRSLLVVGQGGPRHMAQDVVQVVGRPASVGAKIDYGKIGKDLEDEEVTVHLFDCETWRELGRTRTDDDGRTTLELPAETGLTAGVYAVRHVVSGDGSMATSRLTVAPVGTRIVVFDIDGTLTTSDAEINRQLGDDVWERMYAGDYVPEVHAGAAELTRAWADRGFILYYLTGRPYWLSGVSRAWLTEGGFADGSVRTTDRHRDVAPLPDGVGAFKTGVLRELVDAGLQIEAAYGNAATDVQAYAAAGVPASRTYIIGPHGGEGGTVATGTNYRRWVEEVRAGPPARQME